MFLGLSHGRAKSSWSVALAIVFIVALMPTAGGATTGNGGTELWQHVRGQIPRVHDGHPAALVIDRFRAFQLDQPAMTATLQSAPSEFSSARSKGTVVSLPAPRGGFHRFVVSESPVMEPKLARRHPEISTYAGTGLTDPTATVRISVTRLGFQASVRGKHGAWFIDPYYHLDQSTYVSYFGRDLINTHSPLIEPDLSGLGQALDAPSIGTQGRVPGSSKRADDAPPIAVGSQLRTFRLAFASDPVYATKVGGTANVASAKAALINRVTQIFEEELSIRLVLVGNNDLLNFATSDLAVGANGACGTAPCYTQTLLDNGCDGAMLDRNRFVIGQVIGASNFDVGHIGLGGGGGGVARPGVGDQLKAEGCTGVDPPIGDLFAVDYVAHEIGHQFSGRHTWNGDSGSCSAAQYASGSAVEPGSGSSIMAYAGICDDDNLQSNSDPYFSWKSFEEITTWVTSDRADITEVQSIALRNFDGTDSFTLSFNGSTTGPIARGTSYNAAGIQAELATILPPGATATVQGFFGAVAPDDNGFQVTFGGSLATANVSMLAVTNPTGGMSGFVNEIDKGGPVDNKGVATSTGNNAPNVTAPAGFTIPYRTPFSLTGSATDPDGDALTYLWEQSNAGTTQANLMTGSKAAGPLFRQFGVALDSSLYNGQQYNSPGENHPTTDPTRVFPDMAQILANNTNADSGDCSGGGSLAVDCYSEFLPTSAYAGPMTFRLTARDGSGGGGGVNSADTTVNLAPGTGPFRVTAPNTAVTWPASTSQTVTWDVAGTSAAPINTTNVEIRLSTDGGATYPHVLASSTANDGSHEITVPDVESVQARLKIQAVGNIFFDVSNSNFTIVRQADMELVSNEESQDPAYAGETLLYTIVARNNGPSTADNARVVDVLPAGTSYASSSIPCTEAPVGTLTCGLGDLNSGAERTFTVTVSIARDLVYNNGGPLTISNVATADSDRDDPSPDNDQKTEETLVNAKADLDIISYNAQNPPTELMIGETKEVTLEEVIANHGPSAPMDVSVNNTASAASGATVTPETISSTELALAFNEQRTLSETYTISCEQPGPHQFTFNAEIEPNDPLDLDPNLINNVAEESFTVECIVPVQINIHPGSSTNPINIRRKNGEVAVGVLTTAAGEYGLPMAFDATTIVATTVRFGPEAVVTAGNGATEVHNRGHIQDIFEMDESTTDGDNDMMLHFSTRASQLTGSETEACVRGKWTGPGNVRYFFHGCDIVTFTP